MPDRLPDVLSWVQQRCRTIPCDAGTKHASIAWGRYEHEAPSRVDLHRWWTGKRKNNANVALLLGPDPDLLALNINVKNGHDGPATLQRLGWKIPPTPTIRTQSRGLCYFFKVPDRTVYHFPFGTHVHPHDYDGLEFRGAGGYQLVPTSRTAEGVYEFLPPWTLGRFRTDLADLPGAILQAWVQLDRGGEILSTRRARNNSRSSEPRTTPASAHTTDLASPSQPYKRSQARPAATATAPPSNTTTRLSSGADRVFADGFDVYEWECAEAICARVDVSASTLDDGRPFRCRLPGHGPDRDPSASWFKSPTGYYLYVDHHKRSRERSYTVPEVFAALTSRVVQRLPKPSRMVWRLRLMVEEGWLEPEPVPMRAIPDDASPLLQRYCEGFRLLIACKSCHPDTLLNAATVFAKRFAAQWCGIPEGSIWSVHQDALQRDLIVFAGIYKRQALYRPGKDE